MFQARLTCLMLERQEAVRAFSRACANTGKRIAARIAMIAMTTRSSISVNARFLYDMMRALLERERETNAKTTGKSFGAARSRYLSPQLDNTAHEGRTDPQSSPPFTECHG